MSGGQEGERLAVLHWYLHQDQVEEEMEEGGYREQLNSSVLPTEGYLLEAKPSG